MKKTIIFICFCITIFFPSFSQKPNLDFFIVDEMQKPIENVYVLIAGKPITISDKSGNIKLVNHSEIKLQHISYKSIETNTHDLTNNKIIMTANVRQLEEINVLPASTFKSIFSECLKRVNENYPVGNLQFYKINHYTTSENQLLTELDGQAKISVKSYKDFNHNNDIFIDEHTKLKRTYFEEKKPIEYNYFISPAEVFEYLNFNRFDFLTDIKAYDYYLQNKDAKEYEILFSPKEKSKFTYSGKVIIDKKDYGIHLIEIDLTENDNNVRTTVINNFKAVDKYRITSEKIQLYFQKQIDKYFLESAFYIATVLQLKTSKIEYPKTFYTQTILLKNNTGNFVGKETEISLSDLTFIEKKSTKKEKDLSESEKKIKEKVEKYVKENEKK